MPNCLRVLVVFPFLFYSFSLLDGGQSNQISVQGIPETESVVRGIVNSVNVLLKVDTPLQEGQARPPLELSIVLDRSGSMSGDKLAHAKLAIQNVIEQLLDDDLLHLVTYDTTVSTIFQSGTTKDRKELMRAILDVHIGGNTNLEGGLEQGFKLLTQDEEEKIQK